MRPLAWCPLIGRRETQAFTLFLCFIKVLYIGGPFPVADISWLPHARNCTCTTEQCSIKTDFNHYYTDTDWGLEVWKMGDSSKTDSPIIVQSQFLSSAKQNSTRNVTFLPTNQTVASIHERYKSHVENVTGRAFGHHPGLTWTALAASQTESGLQGAAAHLQGLAHQYLADLLSGTGPTRSLQSSGLTAADGATQLLRSFGDRSFAGYGRRGCGNTLPAAYPCFHHFEHVWRDS